jgi:hypothetical protein
MFVWGSKGGVADLGPQGSRHCPVCERERSFRLILQYKISHIWYVFKWVSEKQYALVCDVCQRGEKLVTQTVEAKLGKPKIPSTSGRALMVVVASVAGLILLGLVGNAGRGERLQRLLASPQKNDIYVVNLSPLQKEPRSLEMYGLLRVRSVDAERVEFDTPAVTYDKISAANKDLHSGKVADPAYFAGQPLVLPRSEIAAWKKHGMLHSIERP